MRIGVMLRHFGQPGGIGVYTSNILNDLLKLDQRNHYVLVYRHSEHLGRFSKFPNVTERLICAPNKLWWDQISIPRLARQENLEVIYNPKLSIPLFAGCSSVLVMHGAEQFEVPDAFMWYDRIYFTIANRVYCRKASAIIVMTHRGAKDIVQYMGAPPEKICVIPEAYNENCRVLEEEQTWAIKKKYHLPEKFILFVGGLSPLKNLGNLLRAYHKVYISFPHKLVIAGFTRWKFTADLQLVDRLGIRKHVQFTGFVPDEDLPAIYNLADLFVLPSLYEGFGMPILEAMACGCPVISTETGCSPEVAGDAALLVNPYDPDQIAESIRNVLSDAALREQLITRGLNRAQQFSWRECATKTLALFESLKERS